MMRLGRALLAAGLLFAAAGLVTPVLAKTPRPAPLYGTTVVMQFTGPTGKTRTITEKIGLDSGHACPGPSFSAMEFAKHPELAGWKLANMTCSDNSGGARPSGPAIVLLRFAVEGQVKTAVLDRDGATAFETTTCPFVLQKHQGELVKQAQARFPDGKFVGATCMPRPASLTSFTNGLN